MSSCVRGLAPIALGAVVALIVAGCGGQAPNALPQQPGLPAIKADPANAPVGAAAGVNIFGQRRRRIRFFVITHGQASDPFWAVVQNGAEAAAAQLGVSVTYEAPDTHDIARMRELIRAAIATEARGPGRLAAEPQPRWRQRSAPRSEAGIPVISINSGSDAFAKLGTLLHVGGDEYEAGYAAGERMRDLPCAPHPVRHPRGGNRDLEQRCRGFAAALAATGAHTSVLDVNLQHTNAAEQLIAAALRERSFDGLLTLGGAVIAGLRCKAFQSDHLLGQITYATFGIGPQVWTPSAPARSRSPSTSNPICRGTSRSCCSPSTTSTASCPIEES